MKESTGARPLAAPRNLTPITHERGGPSNNDHAASASGTVNVVGNLVVISHLEDHDAELAAFVSGAVDEVEATRRCLHLGARAARSVQSTVDTMVIERRFDEMHSRFDRQLALTVTSVAEITRGLLDADGGALTATLDRHRSSLEALLGATFDPDSKKSVIALFDDAIRNANAEHESAIRRLVNADGDDSPLVQLKRDLAREVKDQLHEVKDDLKAISEKIAINDAVAPVIALSTAKGFTFEEVLDRLLNRIAAVHGDLAERTGHELGSAATKKGDEVVTLSRDDTPGGSARIAYEAKTQRLNMRATLAELDEAMTNRDASVGVAVFSDQTLAPTAVPFQFFGNKAVVVLDPAGHEDGALRLAYMWSRWVARRALAADGGDAGVDVERAARLINDARLAIERATTIRGSHTKAKRAIDQAGMQLDELSDAVTQALRELSEELGGDAP